MIAQAMRSAIAPVSIPTNTELRLHTTTNNPDAMQSVRAKHVSTKGRQRCPENVVTTPRNPKTPNAIWVNARTF
jgi:hypothetical protein